jgi:methyl-accepting chemotaxis protein
VQEITEGASAGVTQTGAAVEELTRMATQLHQLLGQFTY